jgi:hypothetical protein
MTADEYAREKLMQAVDALAPGAARVRKRLAEAFTYLVRVDSDAADQSRSG